MQINFFGIFRPTRHELDAIEQLGNPGWNWDSLLHYMKKVSGLQYDMPIMLIL